MMKVALHTLGCKLNFAETSTIARQFQAKGYAIVDIDERADVCVINTCSVTERADRECRQIVRRALRHSPDAYIIVSGCYAQLQPAEIARIPGVDLVLGTAEKAEIFEHSGGFEKSGITRTVVRAVKDISDFSPASSIGFLDRTRAFLKIQDGCDYSCAFCTIPEARGSSRSTSVKDVLSDARDIVEQGYKEIVLTGVNVGDYGRQSGSSLLELLRELANIDELRRIRISSVEPNLLTDALLEFWIDNSKLCNHFHIPLQGGNDDILRRMRRRYSAKTYADRIGRIKSLAPDAGIGADVITGFPGESATLFEETYRFLVDLPISYIHVFTYSERPGTPASSFENKVEPRVRFARSDQLRNLSQRKRRIFQSEFVDKNVEVLFESKTNGGLWSGLTSEYLHVRVESDLELSNMFGQVHITGMEDECCFGVLVDTPYQIPRTCSLSQKEVSLCA